MSKTIPPLLLILALAALLLTLALATCTPESIREFSPTIRTIGGPSIFSSDCFNDPWIIFQGRDNICVTIENMGDKAIALYLVGPGHATNMGVFYEIPVGYSKTVCSETDNQVLVRCIAYGAKCTTKTCFKFRWRIDDRLMTP